jgi:hypothetical protein
MAEKGFPTHLIRTVQSTRIYQNITIIMRKDGVSVNIPTEINNGDNMPFITDTDLHFQSHQRLAASDQTIF